MLSILRENKDLRLKLHKTVVLNWVMAPLRVKQPIHRGHIADLCLTIHNSSKLTLTM